VRGAQERQRVEEQQFLCGLPHQASGVCHSLTVFLLVFLSAFGLSPLSNLHYKERVLNYVSLFREFESLLHQLFPWRRNVLK
jgi:hypothetical protein